MTDGLIEFLRARLDEDEAAAAEAKQATTGRWTARETDWGGGAVVEDDCGALILPTTRSDSQYQHIARQDPARVLREVQAKRQLLAELESEGHASVAPGGSTEIYCDADYDHGGTCTCGRDERVGRYTRILALPYADHPDYREEWAVAAG